MQPASLVPMAALTGQQFHLVAGDFAATVVEVGAGLRQFTHRGLDVTVGYGEDELPPRGAGAVLVPWPNRLRGGRYSYGDRDFQLALTEPARGNAIHGLARWTRWTPLAVDTSSVTLAVDLVPQTGWVFEVRVEVTYRLHPETGLGVQIVARNNGRWPAPFGAGFHPYLSLHGHRLDDVSVWLPAGQRLVSGEDQLPVGLAAVDGTGYDLRHGQRLEARRFDDGFTGLPDTPQARYAEVRTESGGARLWFDEAFGFLQLFTIEDLTPGLPAVAIEPMTCPADAFNSGTGLIVLEPGADWSAGWGISPI
jgi:aldose 1-epimerase